jgi:hypothetical protein
MPSHARRPPDLGLQENQRSCATMMPCQNSASLGQLTRRHELALTVHDLPANLAGRAEGGGVPFPRQGCCPGQVSPRWMVRGTAGAGLDGRADGVPEGGRPASTSCPRAPGDPLMNSCGDGRESTRQRSCRRCRPHFRERYDVIEVIGSPYADSRVPELATPIHAWSTTIVR